MNKIKIQLLKFLVAGFSAVATDALFYYILINYIDKSIAKGISFILGTIVAFIINKLWTFEKPDRSIEEVIKFTVLYTSTLFVNIGVNRLVIYLYPDWIFLAFLCATSTSTVLNFLGQKFWVFK